MCEQFAHPTYQHLLNQASNSHIYCISHIHLPPEVSVGQNGPHRPLLSVYLVRDLVGHSHLSSNTASSCKVYIYSSMHKPCERNGADTHTEFRACGFRSFRVLMLQRSRWSLFGGIVRDAIICTMAMATFICQHVMRVWRIYG